MIYFFDTLARGLYICDAEGVECVNLAAARQLAQRTLLELAIHGTNGADHQIFSIRVRDLTNTATYSATLRLDGQ